MSWNVLEKNLQEKKNLENVLKKNILKKNLLRRNVLCLAKICIIYIQIFICKSKQYHFLKYLQWKYFFTAKFFKNFLKFFKNFKKSAGTWNQTDRWVMGALPPLLFI